MSTNQRTRSPDAPQALVNERADVRQGVLVLERREARAARDAVDLRLGAALRARCTEHREEEGEEDGRGGLGPADVDRACRVRDELLVLHDAVLVRVRLDEVACH